MTASTHPAGDTASAPEDAPWTRVDGQWRRQTATSQACVDVDDHQWSAISAVYGYARGQAADHTSAMNCVRAVLRAWGEYPLRGGVDDEHHDDIWACPTGAATWPATLGGAMR